MTLSTYLYFNGNCAEAFGFYKTVFNSDFQIIQKFADGPPDMGIADDEKSKVMHVSLPIGDSILMGSDTVSNFGEPVVPGSNFSVSYGPKTKEEGKAVFDRLAADGEITMPIAETFWGAYFGTCTDKFGIRWMVNVDLGGSH